MGNVACRNDVDGIRLIAFRMIVAQRIGIDNVQLAAAAAMEGENRERGMNKRY